MSDYYGVREEVIEYEGHRLYNTDTHESEDIPKGTRVWRVYKGPYPQTTFRSRSDAQAYADKMNQPGQSWDELAQELSGSVEAGNRMRRSRAEYERQKRKYEEKHGEYKP